MASVSLSLPFPGNISRAIQTVIGGKMRGRFIRGRRPAILAGGIHGQPVSD